MTLEAEAKEASVSYQPANRKRRFLDMSDIVTRLRAEIAWEPEVGSLMAEAADEIARLRLTDEEREAIRTALAYLREDIDEKGIEIDAATLRGLLERTT